MRSADFFSLFGDVCELSVTTPTTDLATLQEFTWPRYNPRKLDNNRWGLPITSLDGSMSGIPDLDSLKEYNKLHNTSYKETDFKTFTQAAEWSNVRKFLSGFEEIGRCHYIKLNAGGFFPWHRDGASAEQTSIRLICPLIYDDTGLVWLQERTQLQFKTGRWVAINTAKTHAVFAFMPQMFIVANVPNTERNVATLIELLRIS